MISDGFGPASETFARSYHQVAGGLTYMDVLPLDTIHVGQSRTRSSNSLVTDSAAGATAFACGLKTYNGGIAVDADQTPCGTVLEAAKAQGYMTGLIATSRITHATPASFSSHVIDRDMENEIALHQIGEYTLGMNVDLLLGGGACHFLPNSTNGSCRGDNRDLFQEARRKNFKTVVDREGFDALSNDLPILGLFTPDHMSYDIDRDDKVEPSLLQMASKALSVLTSATSASSKGFFVMIEGSRIDMAGHSNDPATHLRDILAYQDTVAMVKKYVDEHEGTVMISVADHETGGLTLARQLSPEYPEYLWYPAVLTNVTHSTRYLAEMITSEAKTNTDVGPYIQSTIFQQGLGISDATAEELTAIKSNSHTISTLDYLLADMVSRRAQVGWTTHGHSGVDVNLYAYGHRSMDLVGNRENTQIGDFIADVMDLDLDSVTRKLNADAKSAKTPIADLLRFTENLKHYHSHHEDESGDARVGHPGSPGGAAVGGVNTHL